MASVRELVQKGRGIPSAGLAQLGRRIPTRGHGAAVLCYHDIGNDRTNRTDYYVLPDLFASHLEWIRAWGFTIVPLAEIVDRLLGGRDLDGLVAITFDDALAGVQEYAARLLTTAHVPATVFVVTDVLGVEPPFWPGAARTLDAQELRTLAETGLITLGSHTKTHASLPDIDHDDRATELRESREMLETLTAGPVDLLAYPSGHHDDLTEEASAGAGYRAAFTFTFGRVTPATNPYAIPRFCISPAHDKFRLARQLARAASAWPTEADRGPGVAPAF